MICSRLFAFKMVLLIGVAFSGPLLSVDALRVEDLPYLRAEEKMDNVSLQRFRAIIENYKRELQDINTTDARKKVVKNLLDFNRRRLEEIRQPYYLANAKGWAKRRPVVEGSKMPLHLIPVSPLDRPAFVPEREVDRKLEGYLGSRPVPSVRRPANPSQVVGSPRNAPGAPQGLDSGSFDPKSSQGGFGQGSGAKPNKVGSRKGGRPGSLKSLPGHR